MPSKIRMLDETTINQIAAGEVIESPASCVKELLENALDAGATSISVETRGAGRALIRVCDNGCGMSEDDLFLCIERHATSKIKKTDDLEKLITHGFRGEALASIASVSKLDVTSALKGSHQAMTLKVEGGKTLSTKPASRKPGTTFEIKDLFYNVPVRKKFFKTLAKDKSHLFATLENFALSQPNIALQWIADGKQEFCLNAAAPCPSDLYDHRVEKLLGETLTQQLKPVCIDEKKISLKGYLGVPTVHRSTRSGQYVFINGRPVVSHFISSCVLQGYGTRLPNNRHPCFVLHFNLPGDWVDVNVHPQKKVVRLTEEKKLREIIFKSIEVAFSQKNQAVSFSLPKQFYTKEAPILPVLKEPVAHSEPTFFKEKPHIYALFGRYIFVEGNSVASYFPTMTNTMVVIDEVAARRRLFFSRQEKDKIFSQRLLIPLTLNLNPKEASDFLSNEPYLQSQGFVFRSLSGNSFAVDAIPSSFAAEDIASLIDTLQDQMRGKKDKKRAAALALCQSIKPRSSTKEEAIGVVEKLLQCKDLFFCPLGTPTLSILTEKDVKKLF